MDPVSDKTGERTRRLKSRPVFFLLLILAVGGGLTAWVARRADHEMREDLDGEAVRMAQALNFRRIGTLEGSKADLESPVYRRLKNYLAIMRESAAGCRFVYLLGRRADGTIFFLADSEPEKSEDYSPPGQVYHEASPDLIRVFETGATMVEGPISDRWGTWVSALVPVMEPRTGRILAVMGMDISAQDWHREKLIRAGPPALLTLVLAAILIFGNFFLGRRRRRGSTAPRWMRRLEPLIAAAFGLSLTVFAAWAAHQDQTRNRSRLFVQMADSETNLVSEFFRDLRDFELEALARFYEASEYVTRAEFRQFARIMLAEPSVFSWEWIPAVPAREKGIFDREARAAGLLPPVIWEPGSEKERVPAANREIYYPVLYVEPAEGRESEIGLDQGWDPARRQAMEAAALTGLATVTDPIRLGENAGSGLGLVVYRPIFEEGNNRRLRGFVSAGVRIDSLLLSAREKVLAHFSFSLLGRNYLTETLASTCDGSAPPPPDISTSRPVAAFGKMFRLDAHPGPEFMARFRSGAGAWAALTGLLITAGLVILVGAPLRIREGLESMVAKRTADLEDSQKRYEQLAAQSRTVNWEVDGAGIYTHLSPVVENVFGYRPEELAGRKHFYDLHPEEGREEFKAAALGVFKTKESFRNLENPVMSKDGRIIWVSTSGIPLFDNTGALRGYRGSDTDITERKAAEIEREQLLTEAETSRQALLSVLDEEKRSAAERERLREQLQQAQKMEAVGRLAGGVAHDFNNILQVILWTLDLVSSHPGLPGEVLPELEEIRTESRRAAELTGQLLAFARKQTIVPKILDLNETVEEMLKMLRRLIGENIDLAWQPGAGLWPIKADPVQINQILANLCVNARDAIVGPGRVTIETGNSSLAPGDGDGHQELQPGDYVRLSVSDSGCGMSEEVRDRIFEPFFTTKAVGAGTGLGLATVYGIVKQNSGHIKVHSSAGRGTSFEIYLPRAERADGEDPDEESAPARRGGRETILLVEDEKSICKAIRHFLEEIGYRVIAAMDPAEALSLAEAHPGVIHLLVTDVIMPGMNGRALAERIRELYPDLKCLFMSGYPADAILRQGVLKKGAHFIQKPFSMDQAAAKIREILDDT